MGQSTYKILVEADVTRLLRDVERGLQQIEKKGSDLDLFSSPDFAGMLAEFKKVMAKMKADAESLKLGKVDTAVVDTKPIDNLLKKFKDINKEVTALNVNLSKLGSGANFDGLTNKFTSIKTDLEAINNLLNNGGFTKQVRQTSTASNVTSDLEKQIRLYQRLKEAKEALNKDPNDLYNAELEDNDLKENLATANEIRKEYSRISQEIKTLDSTIANTKDEKEYNQLLLQRADLYTQLVKFAREFQTVKNTIIDDVDISERQYESISRIAEAMEKQIQKYKSNMDKISKSLLDIIPGKYITDDGINETLLNKDLGTTTAAAQSGKVTIPIDLTVPKQTSTIIKQINDTLDSVRAKVASKPIEVPVTISSTATKGDGVKNKTTGLEEGLPTQVTTVIKAQVDTDIAATKQIIKSNVEEIEGILKSAKLALPDITVPETFSTVIRDLREYQKAQTLLSKSTKSTTTKSKDSKTTTSTSSASTTPPIDASTYVSEVKQAITLLTSEINKSLTSGIDDSLKLQFKEIADSIKTEFSGIGDGVAEEITQIVNALDRLQETMRVAFGFDIDSRLDTQWNNIASQFNSMADATGKVDMRKKGVQELLSSMQTYQSKGGTKTFEDLTDNVATIDKLYSKQEKLNASMKEAATETQTASLKAEAEVVEKLTAAMTEAASAIQKFSESNNILLNSSQDTIASLGVLVEKIEALNKAMISQNGGSTIIDDAEQKVKAAQELAKLNEDAITSSVSDFGDRLSKAFTQDGKTNAFVTQLSDIQARYDKLKTSLSDGKINFGDAEQVEKVTTALKDFDSELSNLLKNKNYNIRQGKGTVLDNILFSDPTNDFEKYKREVLDYASGLGNIIDKTITTDNIGTVSVQVRELNGQIQKLKFEWDELNGTVKMTQITSGASMSGIQQFANSLKSVFTTFKQFFSGQEMFFRALSEIKQGFEFVKDLDASLTTMSMTMETTDSAMNRMGESSINMAKKLGSTVDSVTSVGEIYANMNESVDSILAKGQPTVELANASGLDVGTAADIVQGVVNQYKELEGQEDYIVSSLEKVSAAMKMNFGDGINYMSQALQKSGAVAEEAGMSYETFIATAGKISEITRQSGDVTGNAMKTIIARLGRVTDGDEEALSASEVSDIAKAYKSVGINVYNANGEFQDIEVTMSSLAEKWDELTDAERSYIAEKSAGTRQKNTFMVWMNEYKEIAKLAEEAANSDGFKDEVQDKWEQSLTARLNTLKATGQETWSNILGGDEANGVIAVLTQVLELLNGITEQAGLIPTIFAGITMTGLTKSGGRIKMLILNMVYATEAFNGNMYELSFLIVRTLIVKGFKLAIRL